MADVSGRQLQTKVATQETQILNVNSMFQGVYFIKIIRDGKAVGIDKIIKVN